MTGQSKGAKLLYSKRFPKPAYQSWFCTSASVTNMSLITANADVPGTWSLLSAAGLTSERSLLAED